MQAKDYRAAARAALTGFWPLSVGVSFVAALLGGGGSGGGSGAGSASGASTGAESIVDLPPAVLGILATLAIVMSLYAIVVLVIGGAVNLGRKQYYISLVSKDQPLSFGILFSKFKYFGQAFLLQLITSIFIFLWTLLFIIPGIIAAYRYSMAPYILAQNPEIGFMEAIDRSKKIMDGNKWRLFCLQISFIGWSFLCVFTLGIGFLFLAPYMDAAEASFYLSLQASGAGGQGYPPNQGQPYPPNQGQPYPGQPYPPNPGQPYPGQEQQPPPPPYYGGQ